LASRIGKVLMGLGQYPTTRLRDLAIDASTEVSIATNVKMTYMLTISFKGILCRIVPFNLECTNQPPKN
jgi:hypothetical protein